MLINGIDITTALGIKLYDRTLTSNLVEAKNEWADGNIDPHYVRSQDNFKRMTLTFLVLENDELEAFLKISELTSMLKKATIKFDDLDLYFDVVFDGINRPTRLKNGNFLVAYDLSGGYARGMSREIYTTDISATSSFRLNVLYYRNGNIFVGQEDVLIYSSSFNNDTPATLESIGINVDKYLTDYYNSGVASNLGQLELTYSNLEALGTLIINYEPIKYNLEVHYILDNGSGMPQQTLQETIQFTKPQIDGLRSVGELIKVNTYRPDGYKAEILYNQGLVVESLLSASPILVKYSLVEADHTKNITLIYRMENDNDDYDIIESSVIVVPETRIVEGTTFEDIFNFDAWRPTPLYYQPGMIEGLNRDAFVNYDDLEPSYYINYRKQVHSIYVEYYAGIYPNWYRISAVPVLCKYYTDYENNFDITDWNIDVDRYLSSYYYGGLIYNAGLYHTFDDVVNAGVVLVYYIPIDYELTVRYKKDDSNLYTEETITVNITNFYNQPLLGDIVDIIGHKPTGYQFDPDNSYNGEIDLFSMVSASPIYIIYTEIQVARTKNIIIRYKQELASTFATINTEILTISESECVGGVRLKDIINLDAYQPDYYNNGVLDGVSENSAITYDAIESSYSVIYYAKTYITAINYYTDEVDSRNWIGASTINYKIISFTTDTKLTDLGLRPNLYKNAFISDGVVQYRGAVNFTALRNLASIDVVYDTVNEPDEPGDIEYPHRLLFLQHNDLGSYEGLHPDWSFPHAYINTGFTCDDMSKLTVKVDCDYVDEYTALHQVNVGSAYLFGSSSPFGAYYMRFNNQTMYGSGLSGVNTYEAKAGLDTASLVLTETNARGWSRNSGIYASNDFTGYSNAVFTYSNRVATDHAKMPYPLYLFACNNNGMYIGGLANIKIKSCQIIYDGELVRDFIPVQYYDRIGSQVAPSNCLYDKVSQTFFEDATGLNSFNIMDDEGYQDTDPSHQISSFYVNYYKGDFIFDTRQIFYRGDEFEEEWDLNEKLEISEHQPMYYGTGTILNLLDLGEITFENLRNFVFNIRYEELENAVLIYYYKDEATEAHLIATDTILLTEKTFYQVPTFGQIIRLNKYKPDGYQTNYEFPEPKITLRTMLEHAPYLIVYTPTEEPEPTFTTNIKYIKKVFGFRTYETIATVPLTLKASDFRDGEFIDYYIDFDALKPEKYYVSGEPYQWYKNDEHIYSPSKLKSEYIICYLPELQNVEVRYYTDDVDILNLVASTTWNVYIDAFDGPFYIVDLLPNRYINMFKPVRCDNGRLQNTNRLYTFEDLITDGIDIVYDTIEEPGEGDIIPPGRLDKVLFYSSAYGDLSNYNPSRSYLSTYGNSRDRCYFTNTSGIAPYIDLGYTPKELSRLTVKMKYASWSGTPEWENQPASDIFPVVDDYLYIFGYLGGHTAIINDTADETLTGKYGSGGFALRGHLPKVGMPSVYNNEAPATWDGEKYSLTYHIPDQSGEGTTTELIAYHDLVPTISNVGFWRNGAHTTIDDNYNTVLENSNYKVKYSSNVANRMANSSFYNDVFTEGSGLIMPDHATEMGFTDNSTRILLPITTTLSAYKKYMLSYDFCSENTYGLVNFDNNDEDAFEYRCRPKGSLVVFGTRHPDTGEINVNPFIHLTLPYLGGALSSMLGIPMALRQNFLNPYYSYDVRRQIEIETLQQSDTTSDDTNYYTNSSGKVIPMGSRKDTTAKYTRSQSIFVHWADWQIPAEPTPHTAMIWSILIWDQDKLVRDLVPVEAGEEIAGQIMPTNGLFDLITEIFFTNCNEGGTYINTYEGYSLKADAILPNGQIRSGEDIYDKYSIQEQITIPARDVLPLQIMDDPCYYGYIGANYYDDTNTLIGQESVAVPVWYDTTNTTFAEQLHNNDYKPDDFHLNGLIDGDDPDNPYNLYSLKDIYDQGLINIYYPLRTFSKSVVYYNDNYRLGSRDIFFNMRDIQNATTITDLSAIAIDVYRTQDFAPGRLVFNDDLLVNNKMAEFLDAPAPIVIYDKYTKLEHPELLYVEYYRGGASDDSTITLNIDPNYLDCNLTAKVLNPTGTTKYQNHYHQAYYEDEPTDYFLEYQARINNPYVGIHYGPARRYKALAYFVQKDEVITILEERNGWGRIKEYYHGWILLSALDRIQGPGQNPDYDVNTLLDTTIPFGANLTLTKLTIDRLWAYASNYQCWVKTEEISFNLSGKYLNAIDLKVIHLDDIDWTNTYTALTDIGIDPQEKKLRYHDYATVEYNGPIDYQSLSDLHEFEFIYPETIYNYNCYYYNYTIHDELLGAVSFSTSLSDWNPDWDYFLETSWQTDENDLPIAPTLYRASPISLTWDFFGFSRNLYKPSLNSGDGIYLWNPHPWDEEHLYFTFEELARTGTQYVLYPYSDPHLFKYNYGRASYSTTALDSSSSTVGSIRTYTYNYPINFLSANDAPYTDMVVELEPPMINSNYDVSKVQYGLTPMPMGNAGYAYNYSTSNPYSSTMINPLPVEQEYRELTLPGRYSSGFTVRNDEYLEDYITATTDDNNSTKINYQKRIQWRKDNNYYGFFEKDPQAYYRIYASTTNPNSILYVAKISYNNLNEPKYLMYDTNALSSPESLISIGSDISYLWNKETFAENVRLNRAINGAITLKTGLWNGIKTYHNNILQHYFVPVVRGLMWRFSSEGPANRMLYDGMLDIIPDTNTSDNYTIISAKDYNYERGFWNTFRSNSSLDPYDYDYKALDSLVDSLTSYEITTNPELLNTVYLQKATANVRIYTYPDISARRSIIIPTNLVIPATYYYDLSITYDENTGKEIVLDNPDRWYAYDNSWYRVRDGMLSATNLINRLNTPAELGGAELSTEHFITSFIEGDDGPLTNSSKYYTTKDLETYTQNLFYTSDTHNNIPITAMASWHDYQTNKTFLLTTLDNLYLIWLDRDATSADTEPIELIYVVSDATVNYYKYPIAKDEYKLGRYLAGDRVYVPYRTVRNSHWFYTDLGWIYYNNDNLLVVE